MDTVIGMPVTRLRAVTLKAHQGLDALREVAKLAPNVAVVVSLSGSATPYKSRRMGQDGRAEPEASHA